MEVKEVLKEVGFSDDEIKIYLALLKEESAPASVLASKTNTGRPFTYELLERLINKGFVSYFLENNVRKYRGVSPKKLLEIVKEREKNLREILPDLEEMNKIENKKPVIEILFGTEGIKTILNDILREKKDWMAWGSGQAPSLLPYYADHWEKERVKNKIFFKAILDSSESGLKRGKFLSKLKLTEIKFMEKNFMGPSSTWIYGNKVVIIVWNKEQAFATRLISKEIADNYKNHFEWLWKMAKR